MNINDSLKVCLMNDVDYSVLRENGYYDFLKRKNFFFQFIHKLSYDFSILWVFKYSKLMSM